MDGIVMHAREFIMRCLYILMVNLPSGVCVCVRWRGEESDRLGHYTHSHVRRSLYSFIHSLNK